MFNFFLVPNLGQVQLQNGQCLEARKN